MEMYNPAQLSEIYGDWNPETYMQGRKQAGLAQQFQQEKYAQEQQATQAKALANQFDSANNPMLLEKQRLSNEGMGFDNMSKGVKGRNDVAMESLNLDSAKRKALIDASDGEIKLMQNQAQQMAYSLDPAIAEKGKKLMLLSEAAVMERAKHADTMEKERLHRQTQIETANIAAAASRYGADARVSAAGQRRGGAKDPAEVISKLGYEKAAVYYDALAANSDDPQQAAQYKALSDKYAATFLEGRRAAAQVGVDAKPDLNRLNIPTVGSGRAGFTQPVAKPTQAPADGRVRVMSPDGKVGSIPATQLDAAMKAGYKKAN
jgi:hypothetical protein